MARRCVFFLFLFFFGILVCFVLFCFFTSPAFPPLSRAVHPLLGWRKVTASDVTSIDSFGSFFRLAVLSEVPPRPKEIFLDRFKPMLPWFQNKFPQIDFREHLRIKARAQLNYFTPLPWKKAIYETWLVVSPFSAIFKSSFKAMHFYLGLFLNPKHISLRAAFFIVIFLSFFFFEHTSLWASPESPYWLYWKPSKNSDFPWSHSLRRNESGPRGDFLGNLKL